MIVTDTAEEKVLLSRYRCDICHDRGDIYDEEKKTVVMCKCRKEKIKEDKLGEMFKDVKLYDIKPQNESQKTALNVFKLNPLGSYYIFGDIRTGKTHFSAGLFNYTIDNVTAKLNWYKEKELKELFRESELHNEKSIAKKVKYGDLKAIFIDDLGKAVTNDFILQEMYCLIDEIYIRKRRLVITSVFPLEELVNPYGASIVRRIEDIMDAIIKVK